MIRCDEGPSVRGKAPDRGRSGSYVEVRQRRHGRSEQVRPGHYASVAALEQVVALFAALFAGALVALAFAALTTARVARQLGLFALLLVGVPGATARLGFAQAPLAL